MNKHYKIYEKSLNDYKKLKHEIDFYSAYKKVKPQILYNQGRDKKYIYGQVYYYTSNTETKKKSYRFLIGSMDDNNSRKKLEKKCIDIFFEKYI